jgi:PilZ domain
VKRQEIPQQPASPDSHLSAIQEATEKRQHPRVPVSFGVEIVNTKTQAHIAGRATDLGVGGCYVETGETFPEGTVVDLFLHSQERRLHLRALVSYAMRDGSTGMGLAFTGTSPEAGATILDWVTGLGGESDPSRATQPPEARAAADQVRRISPHCLQDVLGELVALLTHKRLLTEPEGAELRARLRGGEEPSSR